MDKGTLAVIIGTIFFLNYMMSMIFNVGAGIVVYIINKTKVGPKCIEAGIGLGIVTPSDFKGIKLISVIPMPENCTNRT